jgi:RNA polymerase sigma factor (sigma-70 family)
VTPETYIQKFGDLIYDLAHSVLWSKVSAENCTKETVRALVRQASQGEAFVQWERSWVISEALKRIRELAPRHSRELTPAEQIMLDNTPSSEDRLGLLESFLHRLAIEDQIILLLRDKYGLPYDEIAAALQSPEGTIKIGRQRALQTLEEWIWKEDSP